MGDRQPGVSVAVVVLVKMSLRYSVRKVEEEGELPGLMIEEMMESASVVGDDGDQGGNVMEEKAVSVLGEKRQREKKNITWNGILRKGAVQRGPGGAEQSPAEVAAGDPAQHCRHVRTAGLM